MAIANDLHSVAQKPRNHIIEVNHKKVVNNFVLINCNRQIVPIIVGRVLLLREGVSKQVALTIVLLHSLVTHREEPGKMVTGIVIKNND